MNKGYAVIGGEIYITKEKWDAIFAHLLDREKNQAFATLERGFMTSRLLGELVFDHIVQEHASGYFEAEGVSYISMIEFGNHTLEELEDTAAVMFCLAFEAAFEDMGDALEVDNADEIMRENTPFVNPYSAAILLEQIYRIAMFAPMARAWLRLSS